MTTYRTFNDFEKAEKTDTVDVYNKELIVVKVKTGRWLLCEENGEVVASKRSEADLMKIAEKLELRRMRGNLHGFRFGSKIDSDIVVAYASVVWGEVFRLENVNFEDGHYWMGDVVHVKSGEVAKNLRMDYLINYVRCPEGMEELEGVSEVLLENGVREAA